MAITSFAKEFYASNLGVDSWGVFHLESNGLKIRIYKESKAYSYWAERVWLYEDETILAVDRGKYSLYTICSLPHPLDYISKEVYDGTYRITKDTDDDAGKNTVCLIYEKNGQSVFKSNYWKNILTVDNNIMTVETEEDVFTILPVKSAYTQADFPFRASMITKISDDVYEYQTLDGQGTREFVLPDEWKVAKQIPAEEANVDTEAKDIKLSEAERIRVLFRTMIELDYPAEDALQAILVLCKDVGGLLPVTNVSIDRPDLVGGDGKPLPGKQKEVKEAILNDIVDCSSNENKRTKALARPIRVLNDIVDGSSNGNKRTKALARPIRVRFKDGTVFDDRKAVDVYQKTIEKVGVEKVRALGIIYARYPLIAISRKDISKYGGYYESAHKLSNGMWLLTKTATRVKMKHLREISRSVGIDFVVEYQ